MFYIFYLLCMNYYYYYYYYWNNSLVLLQHFTVCNKKGLYLGHASFICISRLPNDERTIWLKQVAVRVNIRRLILAGCVIRSLYLLADYSFYLVCGNYNFLYVGCQGRFTSRFILRSCVNCTKKWRKIRQVSHHQLHWQEGGSHFLISLLLTKHTLYKKI